jgi:hypothetical protein
MIIVPLSLEKAMKEWYADLPEAVRQAKYLSEHFNFSQKTCGRWDSVVSKCGVTTNVTWKDEDGHIREEVKDKTLMNFPVSDKDGWMDRTEADDELTVEFDDLQAADMEVILNKKSLADMFLWQDMYSVPGKYADFIEFKCLTPYVVKRETRYAGCPFHTGYELLKQVVELWDAGAISSEDAAELIGPYFLRNSTWLPKVPDGMPWQDLHLKSFTAGVSRHANAMIKKRMPIKKAWAIAWNTAKTEHPEYEEYISNITRFTKEAIPHENIKLKGNLKDKMLFNGNFKFEAMMGARRFFKAQNMDVPREEATKTYDWMVCGSGDEKKASLLAGCPITLHVPDGKYAVRIILQTAVTDRLQELYQVEGKPEHQGWVNCMDVNMPAVEFNKMSWDDRKKALGCECAHCVQRDIFRILTDSKGKLLFRVASEVMLNPEAFDSIVGLLTELTELGVDAISYAEEDFLVENVRNMEYDFTDLQDDKPTQEEVIEYDWDNTPTSETWEHFNWDAIMARHDGLQDIHPAHEPQPVKVYIDKNKIVKKGA